MNKDHPIYHKLKAIIGYSIAVVVILTALGVSGLRLLLTTANLYQQEVEELASSLLEQPVKIGGMDARLSGLEPTLIFRNVELISAKSKKPVLTLYRVDIGLSLKDLVWQQKITPGNITVGGVNLEVTRTVEGKFKVTGVDIGGLSSSVSSQEQDATFKNWLLKRSNIGLEDCNILWKDEQKAGLSWLFDNISLILKNDADRHQLSLSGNLPPALGEKIKLAIDIDGDIEKPELWKARLYLESKALNLAPLHKYIKQNPVAIKNGVIDLKLWGDWDNSTFKQLSGKIDLSDFSYKYKNKKQVNLSIVSGIFDAKHDEADLWRIGVDKFFYIAHEKTWPESRFSVALRTKNNAVKSIFTSANHIRLEALTQLATDNNLVSEEIKNKIRSYNLKGDVRKFKLAWYDKKIQIVRSDFSDIGSNSFAGMPATRGIYGHVDFNRNKGQVFIDSRDAMFEFPSLFRNGFELDHLKANVNFSVLDNGTLFNVDQLLAGNAEVNTKSRIKLWVPANGKSAYLDLQTYFQDGDLSRLSHFLPVGIMNKDLVSWLDKGIVAGKVRDGKVIFNGRLSAFPFNKNEGVFETDFNADDFELNYQENWPRLVKAKINAVFTGQGMKLNLFSGEMKHNLLHDSTALISAFSKPELNLSLNTQGTFANTAQFLVDSPILPGGKEVLKNMQLQGEAGSKIKITIPLDTAATGKKPITYQGETVLSQASLFMLNNKIDITDLNGKIKFNEKSQGSENLKAKILGEDTAITLTRLPGDKGLQISSTGKTEPGKILSRFSIPGADHVSGKTPWQGALVFPGKAEKKSYPVLHVKSDLKGVTSTLPKYFNKNSNEVQNVNLQFSFIDRTKSQVELEFGEKASAVLELKETGKDIVLNRGAVSFSDNKAVLPGKNILYVDGSVDYFEPDKWQQALFPVKSKEQSRFLVYPVILNLDKLKVVLPEDAGTEEKKSDFIPDDLPLISGIVKQLYMDDLFLGRLDFTAERKKHGLYFNEVILSAKNMKVLGQADWTNDHDKQATALHFTLSSDDFGDMLKALGFAAIIDHGTATSVVKLNWQGPPTQFALSKLNGEVQLKIESGSIKEVDAGAGRMLGLFSLSALPRKLFGDFKDTFDAGFSFDEAKGEINIRNGDAYTDGIDIKSPVAHITISGRTGIAARDYENTVTVVPDVGGTAAGVIALLGNIPAGIGLWLVNKLSGDKLNESSMRKYEISGSWDKPKIERIEVPSEVAE